MIIDIDYAGNKIVLRDVPLRLNTVMQSIIGSRHVRDTDDWTVPLSWPALHMAMTALKGVDTNATEDLLAWSEEEHARVTGLYELQIAHDTKGNGNLLPLQRVAASFVLKGKRAINAYDLGGGKTPITCDAMSDTDAKAILIVCPKGLMKTWEHHIHAWTTDITPIMATDSSAARKKAIAEAIKLIHIGRRVALIMNYESTWRHTKLSPYGNLRLEKCAQCDPLAVLPVTPAKCETCLRELNEVQWELVITDEAHRLMSVSKQTRGLWYLTRDARYVWALTGTPTRGSVGDFWFLLRLIDPDSWPSRKKFVDRYCIATNDNWGNLIVHGVKPGMQEEFEQVTGQYMIRRTFDEIMRGWADAKGETYVPFSVLKEERFVDLTAAQRKLYNELVDQIFATTEDGHVIYADNGLEMLTRLLQVSSASLSVDEDNKVTMIDPSPKVKELVQIVRDAGDESVVVFAVNRQLIELAQQALIKEGISTARIAGDVLAEDRETEIERFQAGDAQVILLTYAAGSEGITLTRGHITVRMQLHWSMILNKQAEGRTLRFGQESKTVVYIDVIATDTVESRVHEAYGDKLGALEAIVRDAAKMKKLVKG